MCVQTPQTQGGLAVDWPWIGCGLEDGHVMSGLISWRRINENSFPWVSRGDSRSPWISGWVWGAGDGFMVVSSMTELLLPRLVTLDGDHNGSGGIIMNQAGPAPGDGEGESESSSGQGWPLASRQGSGSISNPRRSREVNG
jgi:hypothetical protein